MKPYFSYLLRIWQAGTPQNPLWAASLEDPHTHQITCFSTTQHLFDHIQNLTEQGAPCDLPPDPSSLSTIN